MNLLLIAVLSAAPDTLWSNVTSGGVYSSVPLEDLNGDGTHDVVCGVNFWDSEPTLWAISGATGDTIWTSDQCKGIYQDEGLTALPDIDGDGKMDILVATPGGYDPPGRSLLVVSGATGQIVWQWSAYQHMPGGTGWGYSCCTVDDWTEDGIQEVVGGFGTTGSAGTGCAACLDGSSGDSLWTYSAIDAVEDVMAVPDVTGDGYAEVCLGIGGNSYADDTMVLLDGVTGTPLWESSGNGDVMCLTLVDRPDTTPLLVSCTFNGYVTALDQAGGPVWFVETFSTMLLDIESGPDVDGDGVQDLALAGDDDGTYCLSGVDGDNIWAYPTGASTWSTVWAESVLVDGEPTACVFSGSVNDRKVSLLDAIDGTLVWEESFTERVYNVSVSPSLDGLPSPTLLVGLQDQQPLSTHAWAFSSSLETSCPEEPECPVEHSGDLWVANPVYGESLRLTVPFEARCRVSLYDLTGRVVLRETAIGPRVELEAPGLGAGIYMLGV
ncbi:PQQ-binding-like beta-propeller repeat protein, partial [Candidatus Fermentibacteria bacterium]|nr:PQQ-binding-like beta-propeller repeat protein [Candidatus Fermentibacteria bacterium]